MRKKNYIIPLLKVHKLNLNSCILGSGPDEETLPIGTAKISTPLDDTEIINTDDNTEVINSFFLDN